MDCIRPGHCHLLVNGFCLIVPGVSVEIVMSWAVVVSAPRPPWICTLPRGGVYWVVSPRQSRDFPRPKRFLKGQGKSWGWRPISYHKSYQFKSRDDWFLVMVVLVVMVVVVITITFRAGKVLTELPPFLWVGGVAPETKKLKRLWGACSIYSNQGPGSPSGLRQKFDSFSRCLLSWWWGDVEFQAWKMREARGFEKKSTWHVLPDTVVLTHP